MRVEVVAVEPCLTCGGRGRVILPEDRSYPGMVLREMEVDCDDCLATGETRRVLATLPDRAELRDLVALAIGCSSGDMGCAPHFVVVRAADAVLAVFGLGEETA